MTTAQGPLSRSYLRSTTKKNKNILTGTNKIKNFETIPFLYIFHHVLFLWFIRVEMDFEIRFPYH